MIHVLQVHKESITKVPNAKPERESTELEIFGMEGIPPEILAAHEGDQDDEKPGKVARVEVPPSGVGAMMMGAATLGVSSQPLYPPIVPVYLPPTLGAPRPPVWPPQPLPSQSWPSGPILPRPAPAIPPRPPLPPPQPLFPIQGVSAPPAMPPPPPQPPSQPLFPIPPVPSVSAAAPPSQPLFPLNGPSAPPPNVPLPASNIPQMSSTLNTRTASEAGMTFGSGPPVQGLAPSTFALAGKPLNPGAFTGVAAESVSSSHMYASGPNTGPCIGPPPVISNKAPGQGMSNEVYLVWDDEAMSMEERRLSLWQYQVHDEAFQMNSVDAAIDKRILESRLAGRMSFGL